MAAAAASATAPAGTAGRASADNSQPDLAAETNLGNWMQPPYNTWSFHNIAHTHKLAVVENEPSNVWALEAAPVSFADFSLAMPDGRALTMDQVLQATYTDGLIVLHNGKIAFETYGHGNTAETSHILMSGSKSVNGLLVEVLQSKGLLDTAAPVTKYLPQLADSSFKDCTVRHLLDMAAGVTLEAGEQAVYDVVSLFYPPKNAASDPSTAHQQEQGMAAFFPTVRSPASPPGQTFLYESINTDVLGQVVEAATGQAFADVLSEHLWRPLGAADRSYLMVDGQGAARTAGGNCTTLRDFARLGQLVADNGRRQPAQGKLVQVVPEAVIEDLYAGGDQGAWDRGSFAPLFAPLFPKMRYHSGWYKIEDERQLLIAMGIHGQNLYVDRRNNIVIAKFSAFPERSDRPASLVQYLAFGAIRKYLIEHAA